jgi:hypothetical protein
MRALQIFLHSSKGLAVELADAEFLNRTPMFSCPIAFVSGKIILRIFLVAFQHHSVPGYFGYNGSRRNGVAELVAFSDGFLRDGEYNTLKTIDKNKIWGRGKVSNGLGHGF